MRPEIPTMAVLLDAFRFHRLRREGAARVLFLLCLLVNLGPVFLPLGKGFRGFIEATIESADPTVEQTVAEAMQAMFGRLAGLLSAFDLHDGLWLAAALLAPLLSMFFALVYANLYVDDLAKRTDGKPVLRTLAALPRLVALPLLLLLPSALGFFFAFLPNLVLAVALSLAPLAITAGRHRTVDSIVESLRTTNGYKMRIAFLALTLTMVMSLPANLLTIPFGAADTTGVATASIGAFFGAMTWLMLGRLFALLYHLLVTRGDVVIPSSENKRENEEE